MLFGALFSDGAKTNASEKYTRYASVMTSCKQTYTLTHTYYLHCKLFVISLILIGCGAKYATIK